MQIHAIDADELVTALARLLCLSKIAESPMDRDSMTKCAAELTGLLGIDSNMVMARADEMFAASKRQVEAQKARWN
jgi:hypothetical protein